MTYKIKVVIKFKMTRELLQKILSISQEGGEEKRQCYAARGESDMLTAKIVL